MRYYKKMVGKKCFLSPIFLEDAEKITAYLNDLEVTNTLQIATKNISLFQEKEILPKLVKEHNYAIVDLQTEKLLGICGFNDYNAIHRNCEIGLFIGNKDYWGKGYGEEAMCLLMDYGFRFLNLRNIMLRLYDFNNRGLKCYKKIGFKEIGRRRKAVMRNMQEADEIYMDILSEEFYKAKKKT
ncbi:MAG: GNAT family N-acetyltransferase [Spirochaetes bacterium]|nr:GNAT family N-acetyltransferase [Spirochaetota bacterium]